jgi:AraC-like DNA-binding protein
VSEVYLRKIFEKKFGVSPKEYMISLRMEYAKQLLSSGEVGVAEVAQMCGYAEPCHFSREFKKRFGISPKNYK